MPMSRRGKCLDNAPAESFFASLKADAVRDRRFETQAEARSALFTYLKMLYNHRHRHSSLVYITAAEYEWLHYEKWAPTLAIQP